MVVDEGNFGNFSPHIQGFPYCYDWIVILGCVHLREKGILMQIITYFVIFFLGGVAAIIIMRLLYHFWGQSCRRTQDDQYLKRIADVLH
jgi:hypothetical protein